MTSCPPTSSCVVSGPSAGARPRGSRWPTWSRFRPATRSTSRCCSTPCTTRRASARPWPRSQGAFGPADGSSWPSRPGSTGCHPARGRPAATWAGPSAACRCAACAATCAPPGSTRRAASSSRRAPTRAGQGLRLAAGAAGGGERGGGTAGAPVAGGPAWLDFRAHAEDEEPLRRQEALQADLEGQGPRAPRHAQPHPRQEEREAEAPAGAGEDPEEAGRPPGQGAAAQMSRVKRSVHARKKRRDTLSRAKGYRGERHSSYKRAKEQLLKSDSYAYRDRRNRKRDFRRLWITRINAAARREGMSYSQLMHGLRLAGVELDRKVLADIAVRDPETFRRFATTAREAAAA